MDYTYNTVFEDALGSIIAVNGMNAFLGSALNIAMYVLTALALYTIAKRRGISKPWLAWVPVLDVWILGSISDQYRYVAKGENKSKRKTLITLSIIQAIIYLVFIVLIFVIIGNVIFGAMNNIDEYELLERIVGLAFGLLGLFVPLLGVAIAYTVIYFMALYDVYTSCDPSNNVLFLVLSIFFGITRPFFLFFSRNKDNGMPPRRPAPSPYFPEESPTWQNAPAEEPWNRTDHE